MKRGASAPLFFCALALAAWGSVVASPTLWLAALAALGATYLLLPAGPIPTPTLLFVTVLLFAAWIAGTNRWMNPSYSAAASYHAAFLVLGYLTGRRAGAVLSRAALAFAACLAAWALWQRTAGVARPSALFETPATLAAVLNLVLLPGLVLAALGLRRPVVTVALLLVAGGVAVSTSRGGWAALLLGAFAAVLFARRAGFKPKRSAVLGAAIAVGVFLAGAFAFGAFALFDPAALGSTRARLALYQMAIDALNGPSMLLGQGYLGFFHVLEAGKAALPEYSAGGTYFVHNDYLQVLLELGLIGLVLLLALVAWPIFSAWRALPATASRQDAAWTIGLAAGLASMAVHASADFPFYIPVCLVLYGAMLGALETRLPAPGPLRRPGLRSATLWRAMRAAVLTVAAWMLAMPVAAEAAAARAHRAWSEAQGERAAFWFEVARRIEPRDWRYHWYAGQFWLAQALQSQRIEAAQRADQAFADGVAANPREVRNLSGRILVQEKFRGRLPSSIDPSAPREPK